MRIQDSTFNIFFQRVSNLRRRFFEVEDSLDGFFVTPFTLIPVPDEAPDEIPRLTAVSHNGHTNFSMSLNNAQIVTRYSENFQKNWEDCREYIVSHVKELYSTLEKFVNGEFLFTGLTINAVLDEFSGENPIKVMRDSLLKYESNHEPYDTELKTTFVLEDRYYVNITFSNVRFYEGVPQPGIVNVGALKEKYHGIGVVLDINDRYAFNYSKDYHSSIDQAEKIIEIANRLMSGNIQNIVREGVFKL